MIVNVHENFDMSRNNFKLKFYENKYLIRLLFLLTCFCIYTKRCVRANTKPKYFDIEKKYTKSIISFSVDGLE